MVEWLDRKEITDVLDEAYNDVLIWNDDDDWHRGIKEGIYIAMSRINAMSSANKKDMVPVTDYFKSQKYEYHYDHTDCIYYGDGENRCPSTCPQYRDGRNDAMEFIFKDGYGYNPWRRRGAESEHTMEEFMYGQDMGNPEDGSL